MTRYTEIVEEYVKTVPKVDLSDFWVQFTDDNIIMFKRNTIYRIEPYVEGGKAAAELLPATLRKRKLFWTRIQDDLFRPVWDADEVY